MKITEKLRNGAEKYAILFYVGGSAYLTVEIMYRNYSHRSMFLVGGLCFILIGLINKFLSWKTLLSLQMLIASGIITVIEFISGIILNLWLKLNIWDYSDMPFNLMGQICLIYAVFWYFLSVVGIMLDDYLRYKLFNEDKPHYKLI